MLTIYHVPGMRSVRPVWLCYELELEVDVELIDFSRSYRDSDAWRAISPAGKVPALVDGDLTMLESGAMVDYILERYGAGRLQPDLSYKDRAHYRQWCWFAEATLIRPLGLVRVLHTPREAASALIDEADRKLHEALALVEAALVDRDYLQHDFTAADIMMGYSIALVEQLLDGRYPNLTAYLGRLKSREAYQRVVRLSYA
ncbi:MAG: glutathione S-transferase family protein [Pseudomonadota bacterium]